MVFGNNAWVFKIQPRAFGSEIHAAAGVACPAVEALIPKVVWVGVGGVLNTVITFAVEPVLALKELGVTASHLVGVKNVCGHIKGHETLRHYFYFCYLQREHTTEL